MPSLKNLLNSPSTQTPINYTTNTVEQYTMIYKPIKYESNTIQIQHQTNKTKLR